MQLKIPLSKTAPSHGEKTYCKRFSHESVFLWLSLDIRLRWLIPVLGCGCRGSRMDAYWCVKTQQYLWLHLPMKHTCILCITPCQGFRLNITYWAFKVAIAGNAALAICLNTFPEWMTASNYCKSGTTFFMRKMIFSVPLGQTHRILSTNYSCKMSPGGWSDFLNDRF